MKLVLQLAQYAHSFSRFFLRRACYGMEWKIVWNGRRISVWNMEDAQNGMEDLKNGMEDRLPY